MECVCVADDAAAREELFGECAAPERASFVSVDGGDCFSIGVAVTGAVTGWGSSFYGELTERDEAADANDASGSSSATSTTAAAAAHTRLLALPTQISVPEKCASVGCGANHVLVVSQKGNVYAWGWNHRHQVSPSADEVVAKPTLVAFSEPANVSSVSAGGTHSLALDSDGRVWSWGDNTYGQLGVGSDAEVVASPDGKLFTFGWGLYHQLGHGSTWNQHHARSVDALSGLDAACGGPIVQVACGNWHTAARTAAGDIYTWGWGRDGQLGLGDAVTTQPLPRVVAAGGYFDADDPSRRAIDVACGSRHTLVLSSNGEVHWWGKTRRPPSRDAWGQLAQDRICRQVAAGHAHALLLVEPRGTSDDCMQ